MVEQQQQQQQQQRQTATTATTVSIGGSNGTTFVGVGNSLTFLYHPIAVVMVAVVVMTVVVVDPVCY